MQFMLGIAISVFLSAVSTGKTAELIYQPVNPSFGGSGLNANHLLGLADRQNKHLPQRSSGSSSSIDDNTDRFVRNLQARLLSSLAAQTVDAIFGEDPQESGEVVFGDQRVTFVRELDQVRITIFDSATGSTTDVVVPLLETDR